MPTFRHFSNMLLSAAFAAGLAVLVAGGLYLGWRWWLLHHRHHTARLHPGIVIHHTATGPTLGGQAVTVATIDRMHARRGFGVTDTDGTVYHIGYHYLILQDGRVYPGRPEYLPGAHARGYPTLLGIVLVGDYQPRRTRGNRGPLSPPAAQMRALETLTVALMRKYDIRPNEIHLHRELGQTACPGANFPRKAFIADVAKLLKVSTAK